MKKFTDLRESNKGSVSVKTQQYDFGKMMTVHHGSNTSYPLHPEHQEAIKNLKPGDKTAFKDETGSQVHAHREGDEVTLHRPKHGGGQTKVPYHHFDTSKNEEVDQIDELSKGTLSGFIKKSKETFKGVPNEKKGNRLRNVLIAAGKKDLKKEEVSSSRYKADVERAFPASGVKTIEPKHKYSTMPKEKAKGMPAGAMRKEEAEQVDEAQMSHNEIQHAVEIHKLLKNNTPGQGNALKSAHMSLIKKHGSDWRRKAGIVDAGSSPSSIYKEENEIEEGILDTAKAVGKKIIKKLGHGSDADMIKDLAKKMKPVKEDTEIVEGYSEEDIANGGTVIYKKARSRPGSSGWSHHMSKVSHKTGGGAGTIIHTTSGHKVPLHHVVSTDASDWKGLKEDTEQIEELSKPTLASYAKKAKGEMGLSAFAAGAQGARGEILGKAMDMANAKKRSKGLDKAINRLASEGVVDEAHLENDRANKHLHHATSPNASHKNVSASSSIDKHAKELNKVAGHGNKETMFNKAMGEEAKTSKAKSIMALAKAGKSYVKVHNPTNDKVNENSLHADFLKMLNDKGIKHRVHGTPEQERQRTAEKIASNIAKSKEVSKEAPKKKLGPGTFGDTRGYGQGRYMGD